MSVLRYEIYIFAVADSINSLTTYCAVLNSYPSTQCPKTKKKLDEIREWWQGTFDTKRGLLHRNYFHRIVLDESAAITAHRSRTSIAW